MPKRNRPIQTIVYGVQHRFSKLQAGQSRILLADLLEHAKNRPAPIGRRHAVAVELTPPEFRLLLEHPDFGAVAAQFHPVHEKGKIEYLRFWHEVVHALNPHFDVHPVDDQTLKDGMDQALKEGKTDVANVYFQERSHRSGEQIAYEEQPGHYRYLAALLGLSHLQGNQAHRRTGLYRHLSKKGMQILWFQSRNREGRTNFSVLKS